MDIPKIEIPAGARGGVLIVDDTPAKLMALAAIVSGMALEIVTATSGEQALRQLLKRDFAVILLDVNMPIMDGFETAKLIRSRPRSEHTPIIFVTAEANSEAERSRGYTLGAVDFIYSPIIPEILRAKVQVFVDLFNLQSQVLLHNEHLESLVAQRTVALTEEIVERKRAEEKVKRLNRIHAVLSGINTTIVRVRDRQELLTEACRIAVEHGQFRTAWIGLLDSNGEDVTPVAKAGFDDGYLDQIRLTARDDVPDSGPLEARALRGNVPIICNDIGADPLMARWREAALQSGYRSLAVFQLHMGDKTVGLLMLYASEKDFFDTEEMRLLAEIAGGISFALDHIEKEERLNYLAYYDVVTGLANRDLFHDRLNQFLLAASENDATVALLRLELEQFRVINETLGRQAGDTFLKQVAERLRGAGLDANHLAHTGAGCFAVVLDNLQKEADVAHILEKRIIDSLRLPFVVEGTELHISAKVGIALFPADGAHAYTLLRNATAALEKAKLSGDKYLFYTPEINARVAEKLSLENKLRQAVEKEQFVLHYQPKVELEKRTIVGVEALIRWQSPELGLVPPLRFIPLLEETGMILEVGAWALRRAMLDYRHWMEMGLAAPRIAVNVSTIQLQQREFINVLRAVIGGDGRASGIDLEITESLIMDNVQDNITKLQTIRDMGIGIAIDDFGTGYSSLAYLAKLPVQTLKIDRAFIIPMLKDPNAMLLVQTMISLAHSLGLKVVAEGVEDEEQAKMLRLLKCDEMQGYLYSPAVPAEQIERFLREKKVPSASASLTPAIKPAA